MSLPSKAFVNYFIQSWDRFIAEESCGINVNPCSDLLMPLDHVFFVVSPPHETRTLCSQLPPVLPVFRTGKNAHDRANQSTRWQQSQAALMNRQLEASSIACDVTMAFVPSMRGSFQLSADLSVSKGSRQMSVVILLLAMISNVT